MDESNDVPDLAALPDDALLAAIRRSDEAAGLIKAHRAAALGELHRRHGAAVTAQLTADGKSRGTTTFLLSGVPGAFLKGEIKQTVKWDSEKLLNLALSMPETEARRYFKFDVSVPERAFNEATGNFRAALEAARTTVLGALTITPGRLAPEDAA